MLVRCLRWFFEYFARDQCQRTLSAAQPLPKSIRGNGWADAAPAFDLIERRLFGFKNVNQIHLIHPQPAIFFALIFSTLRPPLRAFTSVRQLQGTRHLDGSVADLHGRPASAIRHPHPPHPHPAAHFIACILNKCLPSPGPLSLAKQISALTPLGANKRRLTLPRHSLLLD